MINIRLYALLSTDSSSTEIVSLQDIVLGTFAIVLDRFLQPAVQL